MTRHCFLKLLLWFAAICEVVCVIGSADIGPFEPRAGLPFIILELTAGLILYMGLDRLNMFVPTPPFE